MTMEELLTSLIKKARQECEEAHRQLVAATNGLAGVFIVKEMVGNQALSKTVLNVDLQPYSHYLVWSRLQHKYL